MVIQVAKKLKRKNNILFGLVLIFCFLIIVPVISLIFNPVKSAGPKDEKEPAEEVVSYYEITFVVDECCQPIDSILVKVGEKPILPEVEMVCTHKAYDNESREFVKGHAFECWLYNGQYITQFNCPAFNTNVVLVAKVGVVSGFLNVFPFPKDWV